MARRRLPARHRLREVCQGVSPALSSAPRGVHEARQELGGRLRALKEAAGMDGRTLAGRLGWPPSKISKIQLGRQSPTESDIREWWGGGGGGRPPPAAGVGRGGGALPRPPAPAHAGAR
ncbi:helix-turn-helix domain-containing protein, partial [Streptomyces xiamenensis]